MASRDSLCKTPIVTAANVSILATNAINGTYPAWKAFNGEFPTTGTSYVPLTTTFFIGWNFGANTAINYVNIYYDYASSSFPTSFVIEGSNDNSTWDILKTFNVSNFAGNVVNKFVLDATFIYRMFRYRVVTNTGGSYAYVGEVEFCYDPNLIYNTVNAYTWDTVNKGANVTITANNENNLVASYTQAPGAWVRGGALVRPKKCFWAIEVSEIAADADLVVGVVSYQRTTATDLTLNEPGLVHIPAGTLSVGSIIFVKVDSTKLQVLVYVDGVLAGTSSIATLQYLVPALGDLAATSSCRFTAHFGATAIPGVANIFGNPAYWQHYVVYDSYTASSWVLALTSKEFDLDVYLTQFEFVAWWDPIWGMDSNSGNDPALPVKTWAQCLNIAPTGVNVAIVMAEGTSFTGAISAGTGLLNIAAEKKFTIVGDFRHPDAIPSIVATNYAAIINNSPYTKFVRVKIVSKGTNNTTTIGTASILAGLSGTGAAITFENCYLSPQGATGFLWMATAGNQVTLKNCVIEYPNKAYVQEVFRALTTTTVTMTNCAFIGTFTHRGTASYMAAATMISGVYSSATALPGHTLGANCVQDTLLVFEPVMATLHTGTLDSWLGTGTGTNLDGSTAHRGVYGGNAPWAFLPLDLEGGFQNRDRAELSLTLRGAGNKIWNNDISSEHSNLIATFTSYTGSNVRITASKPDVD